MMSMSGGWFFVVASEAITVGNNSTKLPGIGSYIDLATSRSDYGAVFAAIVTMALVILAYDQLLFRPLVAFSSRFRVELVASQQQERSWVMDAFAPDAVAAAACRAAGTWASSGWRLCRFAYPTALRSGPPLPLTSAGSPSPTSPSMR